MTSTEPHMRPMSPAFNAAVWTCANACLPRGWAVDDRQHRTLADLTEELTLTGRLTVWREASGQTVFADEETNYAFRAWHDYRHVMGGYEMTPAGERATAEAQVRDLVKLYGTGPDVIHMAQMLLTEVVGQLEHEIITGSFPEDQRAFAVQTVPLFEGYARRVVREIATELGLHHTTTRAA